MWFLEVRFLISEFQYTSHFSLDMDMINFTNVCLQVQEKCKNCTGYVYSVLKLNLIFLFYFILQNGFWFLYSYYTVQFL